MVKWETVGLQLHIPCILPTSQVPDSVFSRPRGLTYRPGSRCTHGQAGRATLPTGFAIRRLTTTQPATRQSPCRWLSPPQQAASLPPLSQISWASQTNQLHSGCLNKQRHNSLAQSPSWGIPSGPLSPPPPPTPNLSQARVALAETIITLR